ncbi:MAG TPA: site-2 protease family protein [Gaiellales bacterium]|jgi:Zn-dependent protease
MSYEPWEPRDSPTGLVPPPAEAPFQSPVQEHRGPLRRLGGGITAAGLLVLKFVGQFAILLKFKFLFTFALAVGAYALFWGWWFGLGFAVLLLVHELGHVIWLRREGISASLPVFIPFMGAFVAMKEMPRNAYVEAKVGLAGPVLGTAGALVTLLWAEQVNSDLLRALAYLGFLLNLFNLIPVVPLDGGRAVSALHPGFWFAGLFAIALLFFKFESPILLIVLLFACYELYRRWGRRNQPGYNEYHSVTIPQRIGVATVYLGLVVLLVAGMHAAYVPRPG